MSLHWSIITQDLYFGIQVVNFCASTSTKFMQQLRSMLAYEIAQQVIKHEAKGSKAQCNWKVNYSRLEPGGQVLLRRKPFKGKHTIHGQRGNTVYMVEQRCYQDMPVFKMRPQKGEGKAKLSHW